MEVQTFRLQNSTFYRWMEVALWLLLLVLIVLPLNSEDGFKWVDLIWISFYIISGPVLLWLLRKKSRIKLLDDHLLAYAVLFKSKIRYEDMKTLQRSNTIWFVGMKYTLGVKGWILKYGRFNEILIGPESEREFIAELKKRAPRLEIID